MCSSHALPYVTHWSSQCMQASATTHGVCTVSRVLTAGRATTYWRPVHIIRSGLAHLRQAIGMHLRRRPVHLHPVDTSRAEPSRASTSPPSRLAARDTGRAPRPSSLRHAHGRDLHQADSIDLLRAGTLSTIEPPFCIFTERSALTPRHDIKLYAYTTPKKKNRRAHLREAQRHAPSTHQVGVERDVILYRLL